MAECLHLEYDLDVETGYVCTTCGVQLVYCWECADAMMWHAHGIGTHVHVYPEHVIDVDFVQKKNAPGVARQPQR